MGSRTDLGRHGGGFSGDLVIFRSRIVPGLLIIVPGFLVNVASIPGVLFFTEVKNSISKYFYSKKLFGRRQYFRLITAFTL